MTQPVEDLITRQNGESCVLMSLEEYHSREETAYLMRSPKNARRLMDSIESLKSGNGVTARRCHAPVSLLSND